MKNRVIIIVLSFLLGCKVERIEHTFVKPEILNDSIYSKMPGNLLVCDEELIWSDPFSKTTYLHVIDSQTGREIGTMGNIGLGPKEFITPLLSSFVRDRHLYVYDVNSSKKAFFSLDSFLLGKDYHIDIQMNSFYEGMLKNNFSVKDTKDENPYYFEAITDGDTLFFGNYPIANEMFHFGGNMAYDPKKGYLVYALWDFPYIALYQKEERNFRLLWELKDIPDYYISENRIYLENEKRGARGIVLLKDYIVTIERDRSIDKTDESKVGRNFSKLPHTLYVYDYTSKLIKIINFQMPIVRIGGEPKTNTIYAIVVNPEFTLVKCDII